MERRPPCSASRGVTPVHNSRGVPTILGVCGNEAGMEELVGRAWRDLRRNSKNGCHALTRRARRRNPHADGTCRIRRAAPLIETALRTRMAETPQPVSPHTRSVVGEMIPVFCNGSAQGCVEWGRNHFPPQRPGIWANLGGVGARTILEGGASLASNHGSESNLREWLLHPNSLALAPVQPGGL